MANLTRYTPFNEAVSLREAMDRLFEDSYISPRVAGPFGGRGVTANLFETPDSFILQVPMPGVKPEDVEITAQQDTLSLKWETKAQVPEGATVHWHGFGDGHQEALRLWMSHDDRSAMPDLFLENRQHASATSQDVAEANAAKPCVMLMFLGLHDHFANSLRRSHD